MRLCLLEGRYNQLRGVADASHWAGSAQPMVFALARIKTARSDEACEVGEAEAAQVARELATLLQNATRRGAARSHPAMPTGGLLLDRL
jgi:hypothetical protein